MKNFRLFFLSFLLILSLSLSSCSVIGDIFEAGFWMAIILVVIVVAIIWWIIKKVS